MVSYFRIKLINDNDELVEDMSDENKICIQYVNELAPAVKASVNYFVKKIIPNTGGTRIVKLAITQVVDSNEVKTITCNCNCGPTNI